MKLKRQMSISLRQLLRALSIIYLISSLTGLQAPSASYAAPSTIQGSIILGTGKYLKTADSTDFVMGSGDFTLELWVHPTALPATNYTGFVSIGMPSDLTNGTWGHEIRIGQSFAGDGKLGFMAPDNTSTADVWTASASAIQLGRWSHLALVRSSSTLTLYLNGTSVASRTSVSFTHTGYTSSSGNGALFIGRNGGWGDGEFTGSVADLRLIKGTAIYTSTFTAPTDQLSIVGGSNTKALISSNYSSSNTLADYAYNSASNNLQLTATGTPTSSNVSPYQPIDYALSFTAASSMAGVSDSSSPPLGNLNTYTVEGWIKPTSNCTVAGARCEAIARDGDYDISLYDNKYKLVIYYNGTSNTGWLDTGIVPQAGKWTHIALTRSGTAVNFYINGVLSYSYTLAAATAANYSSQPFRIGYVGYASYYFDGQIDEVKLWNSARTQAQISAGMYAAPSDLTDSTLLAYYDFNTGYGATLINRKVGAAATSFLTLSNSPSWVDVKTSSTSGIDTQILLPRTYINTSGGFKLPTSVSQYDYLVVGGGGGGGNGYNNGGGGGGGGGMVRTGTLSNTPGSVITATVGAGGAGGADAQANNPGVTGDSSTLASITSLGGEYGKGSRTSTNGLGGAKQNGIAAAAVGGNGGGAGGGGGGGGGAGNAGGNGSGAAPGNGGSGLAISIGSTTATYGAGGAGARGSATTTGVSAASNTGNGGGGGGDVSSSNEPGGNGGSGIIILHYSSGNSLTYSISGGQPTYRTAATISATSLVAGTATFYERGKLIAGCRNRPTNGSLVATCSYKPSIHGPVVITISFSANSGATSNTSLVINTAVVKRTNSR